jgi:hypothetical protein
MPILLWIITVCQQLKKTNKQEISAPFKLKKGLKQLGKRMNGESKDITVQTTTGYFIVQRLLCPKPKRITLLKLKLDSERIFLLQTCTAAYKTGVRQIRGNFQKAKEQL